MCLILFAKDQHPDFPLIVAANRDEFFARPTEPAGFWEEDRTILAGRDLTAGGTWLGINTRGQFTAVTNFRDGAVPQDKPGSRGQLTRRYLSDNTAPQDYISHLHTEDHHYNGYNLLVGNAREMAFHNNHAGESHPGLQAGVYGLSNASLNSDWPKVRSGREELTTIMKQDWTAFDERVSELFQLLADDTIAPNELLPSTGISKEKESLLSSRFINIPDYGTRASTVVIFTREGDIHFIERSFDHQQLLAEKRFLVTTESAPVSG